MTSDKSLDQPPVSPAPTPVRAARHVDPTLEHRAAADHYLRGEAVPEPLASLLTGLEPTLTWAQRGYITEARAQGPATEVWESACWSIANALARVDDRTRVV
jgi:hypothetical protein